MSNIIDISSKITNQLPIVKITEDIVATVNNRKSTILNMQLLVKEQERKAKERAKKQSKSGEVVEEEYDELAFMDKILNMLISAKTTKEINELDLPFPEYKVLYGAIMNAATGQKEEDSPRE